MKVRKFYRRKLYHSKFLIYVRSFWIPDSQEKLVFIKKENHKLLSTRIVRSFKNQFRDSFYIDFNFSLDFISLLMFSFSSKSRRKNKKREGECWRERKRKKMGKLLQSEIGSLVDWYAYERPIRDTHTTIWNIHAFLTPKILIQDSPSFRICIPKLDALSYVIFYHVLTKSLQEHIQTLGPFKIHIILIRRGRGIKRFCNNLWCILFWIHHFL